jgi:hypothetical protein
MNKWLNMDVLDARKLEQRTVASEGWHMMMAVQKRFLSSTHAVTR